MGSHKSIGSQEVKAAIERLVDGIRARHDGTDEPVWVLGIANGGLPLAQRLAQALGQKGGVNVKLGAVDISFHRDDIGRNPIPKDFTPTQLPGDVTGATVILVDDVFQSGRTVKAALDELFDHGRPGRVELAVLVDRGERRLPITPDYVGMTLSAGEGQTITVTLEGHGKGGVIRIGHPV